MLCMANNPKQSHLQEKIFDGAFLLLGAFSESAFFESAFFEGAFLESAFLECAFSETYQRIWWADIG